MDIDEQLKILIEPVCNAPGHSPTRQKALNRLLILVQRSPGLKTSSHPDYLDALNRTWKWFSKNIQTFRPRPLGPAVCGSTSYTSAGEAGLSQYVGGLCGASLFEWVGNYDQP